VLHASEIYTRAQEVLRTAGPCIEELCQPDLLLKRKNACREELLLLNRLALGDEAITDSVVIMFQELAQGDVFAFTRAELAKKQRELDSLREDITNVTHVKHEANVTGDMKTVEKLCYQEMELQEKVIDRLRQRIELIYECDSDIREYIAKYQGARETSETTLQSHTERNEDFAKRIGNDVQKLIAAKERMTVDDAALEEEHNRKMEDTSAKILDAQKKQTENWTQIFDLLDKNKQLAIQRRQLAEEQLALHATEVHRKAEIDAWFGGAQEFMDHLHRAQELSSLSRNWLSSLRKYVNYMCTTIENKKIDEEAWTMRVQEQLDYLKTYREFKLLADDLCHRKEMRVMSLLRIARNFALQIKEASATLDPNKKRYEVGVSEAETEAAQMKSQIQGLNERIAEQTKMWKVIEQSLEEAHVDFEPPDITAEKQLCEKKAQALSVAREFVNSEQETVDKDTMKLRKLKTSNQVAIEGLQKRRLERSHLSVDDVLPGELSPSNAAKQIAAPSTAVE
jgi:hypothetical protein